MSILSQKKVNTSNLREDCTEVDKPKVSNLIYFQYKYPLQSV